MHKSKKMTNKLIKKEYIPFAILIIMILLSFVEEFKIGEGGYFKLLQVSEHRKIRFAVRGTYAFILFILGYIGLAALDEKWVKKLWIQWNCFAFLIVTFRIVLSYYFVNFFSENLLNFFSIIYYTLLTPFSYFFLWMLTIMFKKK